MLLLVVAVIKLIAGVVLLGYGGLPCCIGWCLACLLIVVVVVGGCFGIGVAGVGGVLWCRRAVLVLMFALLLVLVLVLLS